MTRLATPSPAQPGAAVPETDGLSGSSSTPAADPDQLALPMPLPEAGETLPAPPLPTPRDDQP